ncbi:MAG: TetR/AcrR family transcriptional regulator [Defluviitaleaceae bacterium]|nr:TetR/AcrR family transcriptional regulator [Defluviitaleaceae bacterium]
MQTPPTALKFLQIPEEPKRDKILNAAMKEFRYGYKKASTDTIVRDAGISKGLLFFYFGTKQGLYEFLLNYTTNLMRSDYFEMLNLAHRDILEGFWQMSLLKRDICYRYPYIYDFIKSANIHKDDIPAAEIAQNLATQQTAVLAELYAACDTSLFRADIDPQKTFNLIYWAVDAFFDDIDSRIDDWSNENYETFLKELREYLDICKRCFYKD